MDTSQETIELQRRLTAMLTRYDAGERSSLYCEMRALTDEVVCMIDEAPAVDQAAISKLAANCEALLRSLAN